MKNKYLSLVIILLVTFIAPMIGSYATATFKEPWYSEIILPSFNPPSWVFAPVWTTLYLLMSIAYLENLEKFIRYKNIKNLFYSFIF
jgi:tryptophan-rich sensory protein